MWEGMSKIQEKRRAGGTPHKVDGLLRVTLCHGIQLYRFFDHLRAVQKHTWELIVAVRHSKVFVKATIRRQKLRSIAQMPLSYALRFVTDRKSTRLNSS